MINQLELQWQRGIGRRERDAIHQWLSFASHFSLFLSTSIAHKKSYSGKTVNQSLKYHDSVAVRDIQLWETSACYWQWLWLYFILYACWTTKCVTGIKRLTLLSELGIMVSVIQEPNLDPDARTVMGLLTPVSFPQPRGQKKRQEGIQIYTCLYQHVHTVTLTHTQGSYILCWSFSSSETWCSARLGFKSYIYQLICNLRFTFNIICKMICRWHSHIYIIKLGDFSMTTVINITF